jgi:hypothetical protein
VIFVLEYAGFNPTASRMSAADPSLSELPPPPVGGGGGGTTTDERQLGIRACLTMWFLFLK